MRSMCILANWGASMFFFLPSNNIGIMAKHYCRRNLDKNTDTKGGYRILDSSSNLLNDILILIASQNVSNMLIGNAFTCLIK
jgi:hypothetical protein